MKCSKCGQEITDGRLYCPTCGKEVQLVPDYIPLENLIVEQNQKLQQKKEVEIQRKRIEKSKKKKKLKFIIGGSILGVLLLLLVITKLAIDTNNNNSLTYQLSKAEEAYSKHDYGKARKHTDQAILLESNNLEANLLLAHILADTSKKESAIAILKSLIDQNPDSEKTYDQLLQLYEQQDMVKDIKSLLDLCKNKKILEAFDVYRCHPPVAGLSSGTYDYLPNIDLYAQDGYTVYYTTNGEDPIPNSSDQYTAPITLGEGNTQIKAIAVNKKSIPSDIVSYSYDVALPIPATPKISPSSGEFTTKTKIVINVPTDCKAYYEFDKEPTENSKEYVEPIDMPEGEHIIKVILINEYGKESYVASETYVLEISDNPEVTNNSGDTKANNDTDIPDEP